MATNTIIPTEPVNDIVNRLSQVALPNLDTHLDTIENSANNLVTSVTNYASTVIEYELRIPGIPSFFSDSKVQNLIDVLTAVLGQIGRRAFPR